MKYLKKFEDVYYEPEPESFGSWKERVEDMLETFTTKYVEENMGDICTSWVEVQSWKITISVQYIKEERFQVKSPHGKSRITSKEAKEFAKQEWKGMRDDMIDELKREFDYDFTPHHLTENGYMVEVEIEE